MADESTPSGSEGIDPKLAGLLCYLLSLVGGIVFLAISKDKFVRFHAFQSIFLWVAFIILVVVVMFIPFVRWFSWVIYPAWLVISILMMLKAYAGEKYKLPVIGDLAEKNA
ncbi:MAG: hypothetical protein US94_C0040G0007 [Berkelbacteria bacterium GW2011_GWB1_38_5]|uniref:DUF4870 domain-containing protein n=2 Tax=Candidatus Berkelbacteria TaxID=1618330 RepID=A0A0G0PN00_9BACT|nr:MAG: hypothetical protein US94_C0040G0007 [Berkelbacteria bacterium GW2011_GWB1_38_5]KKQ90651.1 MAG: hypothetical protein UT15_C0008G0002 [Berkelbacteria bacterium GW2011_GWA1_39_10]